MHQPIRTKNGLKRPIFRRERAGRPTRRGMRTRSPTVTVRYHCPLFARIYRYPYIYISYIMHHSGQLGSTGSQRGQASPPQFFDRPCGRTGRVQRILRRRLLAGAVATTLHDPETLRSGAQRLAACTPQMPTLACCSEGHMQPAQPARCHRAADMSSEEVCRWGARAVC